MHAWTPLVALPLLATAYVAGRASVQDDMASMMPNEHHDYLKAMAGTWKTHGEFLMPDPMEIDGTMESHMILGGRFLEQKFSSEFMGMPFEGYGLWGYSNPDGQYQSLWIDTMATHFNLSLRGSVSADGKTFTTFSEELDPMSGQKVDVKDVTVVKGPDEHTFTRYHLMDGKEIPSMKFTYTRQ